MRKRLPRLEGALLAFLTRQRIRAVLAWAALSILAWSLGQLAFIIMAPPAWASTALILALLSLFPIALLWPGDEGELMRELRRLDGDSSFEALIWARPGPARELLEERVAIKDRALAAPPPPKNKGAATAMLRLFSLAGLGLAVLQLVALLVLRHPLLAWTGPEAAGGRGSGLGRAAEDSGFLAAREEEALAANKDSLRGQGSAWKEAKLGEAGDLDLSGPQSLSLIRKAEDSAQGGAGEASPEGGSGQGGAGGGRTGLQALEGGGGRDAGQKGGKGISGLSAQGRGYEESGTMPGMSPLVDYLSRLYSAQTSSPGQSRTTAKEMGLGELRDFERRWFGSFAQGPGLLGRDGPRALELKGRWKAIQGGRL